MPRGKRKSYDDIDCTYSARVQQSSYDHCTYALASSSTAVTQSSSKLLAALEERPKVKSKRKSDAPASINTQITLEKPAAKRQKKSKDPNAPVPEKRGAIFKKACPMNILERVDRVISQRFFMIDRRREGNELKEKFSVLGSTGNVYTVTIDKRPSCTCPDAMKGNHCKHILFIFLKVLQVPQHSTHWYQKALLTSELEELFRDSPIAPNAMANASIREAYAQSTGKAPTAQRIDTQKSKDRRMPSKGDDCPVCYEDMHSATAANLTWCQACGNALHKECFTQWKSTQIKKGGIVTCVYCRAEWPVAGPAARKARGTYSGGYLNLGAAAGLSPQRDTSSYYHGPQRGQRYYGYQEYDE